MHHIRLAAALLFLASASAAAPEVSDLPAWAQPALGQLLATGYERADSPMPTSLTADFDGNKREDVAVVIRRRGAVAPDLAPRPAGQRVSAKSPAGKTGIALILQGRQTTVLGAGTGFGNAGEDFSWIDEWSVMKKGKVQRGAGEKSNLSLRGDALSVRKTDGGSGLIYWDKRQFRWYQQGD